MGHQIDLKTLTAALEHAPARPPMRISSDYDLNPGVVLPEGRVLRPAAVLIAVLAGPDGDEVILTKRASTLKHHPGQIAFPGGKIDGAETAAEAALREAHEEIGLEPSNVSLLAELPAHETVTGYNVTPILARVATDFTPTPEAGEVAEVFRVPLSFLLNPANYAIEGRRWRGARRQYYVVPYGPYYIWGATARMLKSLADQVA